MASPIAPYSWPIVDEFHNRVEELARLERWWANADREPVSLTGRRRVGKSWLFRKFAHGKPAILLVADRVAPGQQMVRAAAQLEPALGVRPALDSPAELIATLYRIARDQKLLVVIDEFPYLIGTTAAEQQRHLTAMQAVLEQERDVSRIKLLLTGSTISTMEALRAERSPLHGRVQPLTLQPLSFASATLLMNLPDDPVGQIERFAIAGGMPRYLSALSGPRLSTALIRQVADRQAPLFDEPRTVLQTELREPSVYFSILAALANNPQDATAIAGRTGLASNELSGYLNNLESLHLVSRSLPVGADPRTRGLRWTCRDDFIRFWFRFIQPYQGELEAGADPAAHVQRQVLPELASHTAPVFERLVQSWLRLRLEGDAGEVGSWWGPSLHQLRRAKERFSEEVDSVALDGRRVVAVAEAEWTNKQMPAKVYTDLVTFKLPALTQAGFDVSGARIVLASRGGFSEGLREHAEQAANVELVDASSVATDLVAAR